MKCSKFLPLIVIGILTMILSSCGVGGSGSTMGVGGGGGTTTITGQVSGTVVLAINENGVVGASTVATGNPPQFSLTFPVGHSYRFYFIKNEGTSTQTAYPFFEDATNIFQFQVGKYYDLGVVTMDQGTGKATASNSILSQGGLVSGGENNTPPAVVNSKIHSGRDWKFFPSSDEILVFDGITGGGSFENRVSNGGTETLSTSYGSVQATKVVHSMYWSGGAFWHTETNWMGYIGDKLISFQRQDGQDPLETDERIDLAFPLYEGQTRTITFQGMTFTGTVDNTNMTLTLPIGTLTGVVKVSATTSGGFWIKQYYHKDYPVYVKFETSDGESEVLREIMTGGGGDTTPPSLLSSIPANGTTGVPTNLKWVLFEFSEAMGPGYSITWSGVDNSYFSTGSWNPDNTWVGFSLTQPFPANTSIGWTLHGGSQPGTFRDLAGNPLPTTNGSFQTSAGPDTTPPTLISSNPADGVTDVPTSLSSLSFTFNESMGPGYSILWSGLDNTYHSEHTWSPDRKTITFPLTKSLPAGTTISWTLNDPAYGGPMGDLAGNPLPATSGSFTTSVISVTQADLAGTWDIHTLRTSTSVGGSGWERDIATFSETGAVSILSGEDSSGSGITPGPIPVVWTLDPSGVITETEDGNPTSFHGNMASNKQMIVGTSTVDSTSTMIWVARKRVPGVTYSNADLYNKSFMFHILMTGDTPEWERGDGTIDAVGTVNLANLYDSDGQHFTNLLNVGSLSIDADGIGTDPLDPTSKGFLTPDKKVLISTGTSVDGGITNYALRVITISGQSFSQTDLAGVWTFHDLGAGTESYWVYGNITVDGSGVGTFSGINTSSGPETPGPPVTLSINTGGEILQSGDALFHGSMSSGKNFFCATATDSLGNYEMILSVK